MACNCCRVSTGCRCLITTGSGDTTPNPDTYSGFSYTLTGGYCYSTNTRGDNIIGGSPWINRKFPEPLCDGIWSNATGIRASDGSSNLSEYSRSGEPALFSIEYNGWIVPNWDGSLGTSPTVYTIFSLESREDSVKRECQLWIKFRTVQGSTATPWGEPILFHTRSWNSVGPLQVIVNISGSYFGGKVDNVELRFQCVNPCQGFNVKRLTVAGAPSYIKNKTMTFPQDPCTSYGSYEGTNTTIYTNWPGGCQTPTSSHLQRNTSNKIFGYYQYCCPPNFYNRGRAKFSVSYNISGGICQDVSGPNCNTANRSPSYCCGGINRGDYTRPDGTEVCVSPWPWASASFIGDPWNIDLIDATTARHNGYWSYFPEHYTLILDCITGERLASGPIYEDGPYSCGSVAVYGV